MTAVNVELMDPRLIDSALKALDARNVMGFLLGAKDGSESHLLIVANNILALDERGLYERALITAFKSTSTNHRRAFPLLNILFRRADPARLREAGDPLPGPGPFTLYRGVSGRGRARRVSGFSWTSNLDVARWFAMRLAHLGDPAVFTVEVAESQVYAYTNGRDEQEFIVQPRDLHPRRFERPTEDDFNRICEARA